LQELYLNELKDLYSAENQLIEALPKKAKAAASEDLRASLEEHLEQTKAVFSSGAYFQQLGETPKGKKGMEGPMEEGAEAVEERDGAVLDAAVIGASQRVEHYEIAGYGTVELGESNHVSLLSELLEEAKETDEKLTGLAGDINAQANKGEEVASCLFLCHLPRFHLVWATSLQ
jgi:ferritin-like metal-binding protein YciE